jgi:hypothetical protein
VLSRDLSPGARAPRGKLELGLSFCQGFGGRRRPDNPPT